MPTNLRAKLGLPSAFVAFIIPVIFAIFEVQEWKIPLALAIVFLTILFLMLTAALGVLVFELIRAALQIREYQVTSASWVSSEAPGLLDYEADGTRASKRYLKELVLLGKDTNKLGATLSKHSERMAQLGKSAPAPKKQAAANDAARTIARSAVYIEKRAELFQALVRDISRNYEGLINHSELETDEDRATALSLIETLKRNEDATSSAIGSTSGYRDNVRSVERQNLSRAIRISSKRLADGADNVVKNMRQFETQSRRLRTMLEGKLRKQGTPAVP